MILLTGGTGYIGSAIARHLISQGKSVSAPKRWQLDVTDEWQVKHFFDNQNYEAAILTHGTYGHIGAIKGSSKPQWNRAFETNVLGCISIIHHANINGPIIVFGGAKGGRVPFVERSSYAASKAAVNVIVQTGAAEGLQIYGIAPGPHHSRMQQTLLESDASKGVKGDVREALRRSAGITGILKVVDAILAGRAEPGHFYAASEWRE
jgi:NAD(P)-dependent dehydrogenase (short-subunit alcohol dehydrogenase family)